MREKDVTISSGTMNVKVNLDPSEIEGKLERLIPLLKEVKSLIDSLASCDIDVKLFTKD